MSMPRPLFVSFTVAGYTVAPIRAWFLRSLTAVDMSGFSESVSLSLGLITAVRSGDDQLVTQDEAGRVPRAGVDVLDAAQVRLVVLQGAVPEPGGQEFHHPEARDDPVREVPEQDERQVRGRAFGPGVRDLR